MDKAQGVWFEIADIVNHYKILYREHERNFVREGKVVESPNPFKIRDEATIELAFDALDRIDNILEGALKR